MIENGITYVEVPDVTCLATMIENLEETDTPPIYYIQVGQKLKHDGTDYGKAIAVYDWMIKNGWGSCVYHSLETYYHWKLTMRVRESGSNVLMPSALITAGTVTSTMP